MPLFKKFCFFFSLKRGALTIAYTGLTVDTVDAIWLLYNKPKFCGDVLTIWIIALVWNVISVTILIFAVYRANPNLLPLHMVTCLIGLILVLISHMQIAALKQIDFKLVAYAFINIGYVAADIVIILSYYHSEV
ncbi:uncharacterized protein LOC108098432 [Drosophila ficusphila]|uniref:uncharacterized protein LOC108098432 n=1 Tax=Drosophila ficusphila TaxID=30025 RepID=UPI0007E8A58A|nr:uncharacterized protein LOC108098432 [Drosophila ficusphila]XP_017056812.1 uncharacterized protein LOC108098432 [Drosophila ficusphila]